MKRLEKKLPETQEEAVSLIERIDDLILTSEIDKAALSLTIEDNINYLKQRGINFTQEGITKIKRDLYKKYEDIIRRRIVALSEAKEEMIILTKRDY